MKKLFNSPLTTAAAALLAFSACSIAAFQTTAAGQRQLAFVDFNGNVKPIRSVPSGTFGPRISPNGKQVAYRDGDAVWIVDLTSDATPRRLTTEPGEAPI